MYLEDGWLNQHVCSHCWTCANTTPWGYGEGLLVRRFDGKASSCNNCRLSVSFVFSAHMYFSIMLHIHLHFFLFLSASLFIPLSLPGWRLCNWQLYKAHSHRRTRHHLLHPAAPEGEGGGHPAGAVAGDGQGSQGRSWAAIPISYFLCLSLITSTSDRLESHKLFHVSSVGHNTQASSLTAVKLVVTGVALCVLSGTWRHTG